MTYEQLGLPFPSKRVQNIGAGTVQFPVTLNPPSVYQGKPPTWTRLKRWLWRASPWVRRIPSVAKEIDGLLDLLERFFQWRRVPTPSAEGEPQRSAPTC